MADEELEQLFTVRQIADAYNVSEETIRRWMKLGHIEYVPVGPFKLKRLRSAALKKKEVSNDRKGNDTARIEDSKEKRTG